MKISAGITLLLSSLLLLTGCQEKQVGATVTGLNYRDDEIRFYVTDPDNDKNSVGGEDFLPYSVGGQLCCYALPAKWHKGLRVRLEIKVSSNVLHDKGWDAYEAEQEARRQAGTLNQTVMLDIPEYHSQGTPTLWVQFLPGDKYTAIVSDAGPRDEAWSGEVKGWPVPSLEYRKKLWNRKMRDAQNGLKTANELLEESRHSTEEQLKEKWDFYKTYDKKKIMDFDSYHDPKFINYLESKALRYKDISNKTVSVLLEDEPK